MWGVLPERIMVQQVSGLEQIALGIGALGMALGTVAFVAMGWGEQDEKLRRFYVITTLIAGIATVAYLAMFLGFGISNVSVPGEGVLRIYWMRYVDWLLTTPLLLLDLALLAGTDRDTIYRLVGLDVGMVVVGAVAAVAPVGQTVRLALWVVSCAFFIGLLYLLANQLSQQAAMQSGEVAALFSTLRNLVIVLWTAYPIVWILGTESTIGLLPIGIETAAFMVLDLSAKVGFGFILLRSHAVLDEAPTSFLDAAAD
jgi:bacteriorhodopsin